MKNINLSWFTHLFRWLALSVLLIAALAACSGSSSASNSSAIPTAVGHNSHISPILHNLNGVQQGQMTMFTLPGQTRIKNLVSISQSSQSNVWFGEYDTNQIGEMNSQGQLYEYPLPTANARPGWGTLGLGGNFWFSEEGANRIAEMSSQGDITEYDIPTPNAEPGQMVLWGGMIWFTEAGAHKLGRMDQVNQMVEFSLSGLPDQIATAGSEENNGLLWFTEPAARRVGHITFDGQLSEFSLPESVINLSSVMGDTNGNLWFTTGQSTQSQLGYVTPDGHFTFFSTGRQNSVEQLLWDGNSIEFIEQNNNTIWTINQQGTIQAFLAAPADLKLPTPLTFEPDDGSYWYAKTDGQQSQLWKLSISPYGV